MTQTGAYGVARFSVSDPLTVVAGARVSNYKSSSVYRDTGEVYLDPYRENGVVTPYGGVIYAFDKRLVRLRQRLRHLPAAKPAHGRWRLARPAQRAQPGSGRER